MSLASGKDDSPMIFHTCGPEETKAAARQVAALLRPGDLIAYRGGMGAGSSGHILVRRVKKATTGSTASSRYFSTTSGV